MGFTDIVLDAVFGPIEYIKGL